MPKIILQNATAGDLIFAGVKVPAKTEAGHGVAEVEASVVEAARAANPVVEHWFRNGTLIVSTSDSKAKTSPSVPVPEKGDTNQVSTGEEPAAPDAPSASTKPTKNRAGNTP